MDWEGAEPSFIVVSTGGRPIDHFNKLVSNLQVTQPDMASAAKYLVEKTRSQALSGFSVSGTPFAQYSPNYAKAKRSEHVDLFGRSKESHMLDNLTAGVHVSPTSISIGIEDNAELALRAAVNQQGLTFSGRTAKRFIAKLRNVSHQKVSGLKRQLKNRGHIVVIPARPFLGVTAQDLKIMAEMIVESVINRWRV